MKSQKEDGVMMTVDTKRLRELAEAATPGPWEDYYETGIRPCVMAYDENDKGLRTLRSYIADTQFPQDKAFIAAANPQAIIALIDELEKTERENVRLTRGLVQIQHILRSRHLSDGEMCLAALSEATSTIIKLDEKIEGDA